MELTVLLPWFPWCRPPACRGSAHGGDAQDNGKHWALLLAVTTVRIHVQGHKLPKSPRR